MDYAGNWPDQNFSDPTYQDDPGLLCPGRRTASPPAPNHADVASTLPRVPRRLISYNRRPASAGSAGHARQLDITSALLGTKQNRGWVFENPFSRKPVSARHQQASQFLKTAFPPHNRASVVTSKHQSTSGDGLSGSASYRAAKQNWPHLSPVSSQKYSQDIDNPYDQWNIFNDVFTENDHSAEELPLYHKPVNWQYLTENYQSHLKQPRTKCKSAIVPSHSMNRPESKIKKPIDYDALIQNMEEVEEREINTHLKDDFYPGTEMGDWHDDIETPDTVMLENFEELEQLIQEEDDDVQLALHIQNRQSAFQKENKVSDDYIDLQRPLYQGNTDYDESDDDLSPEVAAAMMHSEERGILMGSAPSRVFNALFTNSEKDPLAVSSACPFHNQSVVVPTAGGELPFSASAEDLTALASLSIGDEPPSGSVFSDALKKRGSYETVMNEASKAYPDGPTADSSINMSAASFHGKEKLEYVLDPASPPAHFSKVQLRGSILPNWFPGYYKALPHIKGITAVCSDPGIVMEDAWWTLQTSLA